MIFARIEVLGPFAGAPESITERQRARSGRHRRRRRSGVEPTQADTDALGGDRGRPGKNLVSLPPRIACTAASGQGSSPRAGEARGSGEPVVGFKSGGSKHRNDAPPPSHAFALHHLKKGCVLLASISGARALVAVRRESRLTVTQIHFGRRYSGRSNEAAQNQIGNTVSLSSSTETDKIWRLVEAALHRIRVAGDRECRFRAPAGRGHRPRRDVLENLRWRLR